MPLGPAARITDLVAHPLPPALTPGPGSIDVNIGYLNAWRAIRQAAVAALQAANAQALATIAASAGTPAAPGVQAAQSAAMSAAVTSAAGGADIHMCATPLPPHGPGVVITGSINVQINYLPASRQTDIILEAVGPPNTITKGCINVIIGG